jgi:hypothetical protein
VLPGALVPVDVGTGVVVLDGGVVVVVVVVGAGVLVGVVVVVVGGVVDVLMLALVSTQLLRTWAVRRTEKLSGRHPVV